MAYNLDNYHGTLDKMLKEAYIEGKRDGIYQLKNNVETDLNSRLKSDKNLMPKFEYEIEKSNFESAIKSLEYFSKIAFEDGMRKVKEIP